MYLHSMLTTSTTIAQSDESLFSNSVNLSEGLMVRILLVSFYFARFQILDLSAQLGFFAAQLSAIDYLTAVTALPLYRHLCPTRNAGTVTCLQ